AFRMRIAVMRGSVFRDRPDCAHARDAADQLCDFRTKARAECLGVKAVYMRRSDHYRGANRIEIELEAGDDRGGAKRTIQPWLAVGGAPIAVELPRGAQRFKQLDTLVGRETFAHASGPRGERLGLRDLGRGMQDGNHGANYTGLVGATLFARVPRIRDAGFPLSYESERERRSIRFMPRLLRRRLQCLARSAPRPAPRAPRS